MTGLSRLRAHAGQWTLVGLLGAAVVFTTAAAGPVTTRIEDRGLAAGIEQAPYPARDLILTESTHESVDLADLRDRVGSAVPDEVSDVAEVSWSYQYTQVAPGSALGLALAGGAVTTEPDGLPPYVALIHQSGTDREVAVVEGTAPATDPAGDVIEVMVEAGIAEVLGVRAGGEYDLGDLTARVSGLFVAHDDNAPVWDHAPFLVEHGTFAIPCDEPPCPRYLRADLLTDRAAFDVLFAHDLETSTEPLAAVRTRLDTGLVSAGWASRGAEAVARVQTEPLLAHMTVRTGLVGLLEEFERQAAAARAVMAVAAAGIVAILVGLLVLSAKLIMERRRDEVQLVRARGGSVTAVATRLAGEALPVGLLAAVAGWSVSRLALGQPLLPPGPGLAPASLLALVVWLVVPAAAIAAGWRTGAVATRRDLGRGAAHPARVTAELALVALAGAGLLLVQQRGLALTGVDPFLSAVPVLLAVAAGLLALRLYGWPLRAFAALLRRLRGVVGFVALARASRAAPGSSLALVVLVLAVTLGGFAAAVNTGLAEARDDGAVEHVGAHVRVSLPGIERLPDGVTEAVERVPGVDTVAVARRGGVVREAPVRHAHGEPLPRRDLHGPRVVALDIAAYQQVLAALEVDVPLPPELLAASADADPLPVLATPQVADRNDPSVQVGEIERPVVVTGAVADLPGPDRGDAWVLVPRQAWPAAEVADQRLRDIARVSGYELLIAGEHADTALVTRTVEAFTDTEVTVTSLAGHRAELEASGFNAGLTLVLVAGGAAGALGGGLAVGLALVVQARPRGRVLSLLRTMGLSHRQARGLLLVELAPLTATAVAAGAAVGASLPVVFGSALGVGEFTGGGTFTAAPAPVLIAALGAFVVGLVGAGAAVEAAVNRRLGLGGVLRVE